MQLKASQTIPSTLKQAQEESARVTLRLEGGSSVEGHVGEVGDHLVVIARMTGKEFYDAVVRIDAIVAIEARARDR